MRELLRWTEDASRQDRLRVLLTGHVCVEIYAKADTIPAKLLSRSRVAVLPPL